MRPLEIENLFGIFCDAWVTDDLGMLIFASLWGRDIAIQGLLAKLTLSASMDGVDQLHLQCGNVLRIGDPNRLSKHTGRMPKANLFGDMVHLWLYDAVVKTPDMVNRRAYWLVPEKCKDLEAGIWQLFKRVCHLPMLDPWQERIIHLCRDSGWIKTIPGYGLSAVSLELPANDIEEAMTGLIKSGQLAL